MPHATIDDVDLFYEVTGEGFPVVFSHEYAGDYRSWDPQVQFFSRFYRCITYSHRGFPPSAVPDDPAAYSQERLVEDLRGLASHLGIERAHFVGFSMGAQVVLNLAMLCPRLCASAVVGGCGTGSTDRAEFERNVADITALLDSRGIEQFAEVYASGPSRQPFKRKDPKGWGQFRAQLAEHSARGSSLTMLGVQLARETIFQQEEALRRLQVPTLLVVGDEDEPCIDANVFMKRCIPSVGLVVLPQTGHTVNLEEPASFNRVVLEFLHAGEAGRWGTREAVSASLLPSS